MASPPPSVFPREFGDELLLHIFLDVPPEDNLLSLQLVSKKFHAVANDQTVWKQHCVSSFQYWSDEGWFRDNIRRSAGPEKDKNKNKVDWKEVFLRRKRINARIGRLFDEIIQTKVDRLERFEQICEYGFDAKDFLLEQLGTREEAEDVLARRYFGTTLLDSLHRGLAIEVWSRLQDATNPPTLDQAFGAFDMFVLHDQPQDLRYISSWFDEAASSFRSSHPDFDQLSTRSGSLALVRWLREEQGFQGIPHEEDYRNFCNCLIGHAISSDNHPSLPLVSSAIFASLATRLGLDAGCCNAPIHVHAVITSPPGFDLDHNPIPPSSPSQSEKMYLDPYTSTQEIRSEDLTHRRQTYLAAAGPLPPPPISSFTDAAPVSTLIQRMSNNLKTSYSLAKRLPADSPALHNLQRLRSGDPELNTELALYSCLWANLLSVPPSQPDWDSGLDFFLNRFALNYSEDLWLVSKYLLPLYDRFVSRRAAAPPANRVGWENVREIIGMLQNLDRRPPVVSRRYTEEIQRRVRYKIGQVFRHKRYGYVGVINGWAAAGMAGLPTPHYVAPDDEQLGADDSEGVVSGAEEMGEWNEFRARRSGRTYYTCLRPNCDRLRLAQETIEIITDASEIPQQLFFAAGKFFKRFDAGTCTFVSNLKEFYPDD
ncbi:hypothetical protein GE09DRAFT_1150893, partial [Coniochaeta sp. 2T2.1]